MRGRAIAALLLALGACVREKLPTDAAVAAEASPRLDEVGPRMVSNQTAYPLALYGSGFTDGLRLVIDGQVRQTLETHRIDERHLTAVLPAGTPVRGRGRSSERFPIHLEDAAGRRRAGAVELRVIDDAAVEAPLDLELADGDRRLFVASETTDRLWAFDLEAPERAAVEIAVGDGPRALGRWRDARKESIVIAERFRRAPADPGRDPLELRGDPPDPAQRRGRRAVDRSGGRAGAGLEPQPRPDPLGRSHGGLRGSAASSGRPAGRADRRRRCRDPGQQRRLRGLLADRARGRRGAGPDVQVPRRTDIRERPPRGSPRCPGRRSSAAPPSASRPT